jgi:hypothetical protein
MHRTKRQAAALVPVVMAGRPAGHGKPRPSLPPNFPAGRGRLRDPRFA